MTGAGAAAPRASEDELPLVSGPGRGGAGVGRRRGPAEGPAEGAERRAASDVWLHPARRVGKRAVPLWLDEAKKVRADPHGFTQVYI